MPDRTVYEPGTPCWVDLLTPDLASATGFYTNLFGWHAHVDSADGRTTLSLPGDRPVAALVPQIADAPPGTPPLWTTYISVTDIAATTKAATAAGGRVSTGPADAGETGSFAIIFDDQGAHFGVWQPGAFHGAAVTAEPGAYSWSELTVRDTDAARAFYGAVFGWEGDTHAFGPTTYTEWHAPGGPRLAGMIQMDAHWPPGVPAHWIVYFEVADCDATAERATELGGTVSVPPSDIPSGRFAVLNDPQGGFFSIITRPAE